MSDIITRLLLKTNDFDANLNRAKGSVNSFQGGISSMAKTAGAGIMKFAGTIGVAVGAYEGFNKLMNSSQTLSDEYNRTIEGLKGTVDNFFYSIGSGDWTPFFNGLDETIRKAREAYNAMDQLGNTKMSYGYFNMKNQAEFQKQITILKDKDSTEAQKDEAQKRLDDVLKDQWEIVDQLGRRSTEAVQALVAASTGISAADVSMVSVDRVSRFDVSAMGDAEKKQAEKEYQYFKNVEAALRKKYTKVETVMTGAGMNRSWSTVKTLDYESYNKAMAPMIAKYQDAIVYNGMLVKESDEWLKKLYGIRSEAFAAEQAYESMTKTANRASQASGKDSKEDKDEKPLKDTLAWYDAEISRLNKKLSKETTMQARATVQAAINELEKKKVNIKIVVEQEVFKGKYGDMKGGLPSINRPGDQIGLKHNDKGFKLPKFESPIKKEDIDLNQQYADSLGLIGSVMGNLSGITNNSTTSWINWGAGVFQSIAQAIPSIVSLTTALTAKAAAEAAGSAASIPVVGWVAAGAAALSVVATMASIPKFANGGIVPGISFAGDKVPAMLNSGEMILNGSQQANLFKMLNSKLYSGLDVSRPNISPIPGHLAGLISPSPNGQKVEVSGNFKVRGQDLELVLDNRSRIKNKIR
ncbi:hypothetical protein AOQ65_15060 [Bacteroides fragilis]|uniref:hypothetical protein n=1 Tax=Bacteroides fragilis TaxID=817 RepID=UPI0008107482|nr:hypothetical protein [Bacteroides fragilis]OCL16488.1 hypothetical protein AOQ65_15060 [Bacteroides fragilis]OCM98801.1 hypothetical protein AE749_00490 [Bacteroides fragilis]